MLPRERGRRLWQGTTLPVVARRTVHASVGTNTKPTDQRPRDILEALAVESNIHRVGHRILAAAGVQVGFIPDVQIDAWTAAVFAGATLPESLPWLHTIARLDGDRSSPEVSQPFESIGRDFDAGLVAGGVGAVFDSERVVGQVTRAWQLAYCRNPEPDELVTSMTFLSDQIGYLQSHRDRIPAGLTESQQALTDLCQVLLTSNEFLYVE